ncbi:DNA methyltransferase Dim-2 [Agyrium rufum]|nr:DNA methyltransferase Dim-2 [Agyrium rufum]
MYRSKSDKVGGHYHDTDTDTTGDVETTGQRMEVSVLVPPMVFPGSSYQLVSDSIDAKPVHEEGVALWDFLDNADIRDNDVFEDVPFTSVRLEDFVIYRPARDACGEQILPNEFAALHEIKTRRCNNYYLFDGYLTADGMNKRYVEKVKFEVLQIGGYEDLSWVANLTKFVIDFLHHHELVDLARFSHEFYSWLLDEHGNDQAFQYWLREFGSSDFRQTVSNLHLFIWKEATSLGYSFESHPLWAEIDPENLHATPQFPLTTRQTIVIDYVYRCFLNTPWTAVLSTMGNSAFLPCKFLQLSLSPPNRVPHKHVNTPSNVCEPSFSEGDTVLFADPSSQEQHLFPGMIEAFTYRDHAKTVRIRKLLRKCQDLQRKGSRLNELVYSSEILEIAASSISRLCHVRFFTPEEVDTGVIPIPYSSSGTGDYFYLCSRVDKQTGKLLPLYDCPADLNESYDPRETPNFSQLRTLDAFCGGGNFGHGMADAGAIKIKWAIDINPIALHTYRANLSNPDDVQLFCGSISDYIAMILQNSENPLIAKPGEVDLIIGGSPCQGFSLVNPNRGNIEGLRNQSLITSLLSLVDLYRPKYALFENVLSMDRPIKIGKREYDVLALVTCALKRLGYQVNQFCVDAWSYGAPQQRSRLFISASAPGLKPLRPPPPSHSHIPEVKDRKLRRQLMAYRPKDYIKTPFKYVTMGEALADLPPNFDACVPKDGYKANIVQAYKAGRIPKAILAKSGRIFADERKLTADSHLFQRWSMDGLHATVLTKASPGCSRTGKNIHPREDRCTTVLEAARAQGFPDDYVILGSPVQQYKIIGNSVARQVALAFGLALRDCCIANASTGTENEFVNGLYYKQRVAVEDTKDEPKKRAKEESPERITSWGKTNPVMSPISISSDTDSDVSVRVVRTKKRRLIHIE